MKGFGAPATMWRVVSLLGWLAMFWLNLGVASFAASGPRMPCGVEPFPAYSLAGEPARVAVWLLEEVQPQWSPPECSRWKARNFNALITVSGQLRGVSEASVFLRRIAMISVAKSIIYWSYSRKTWRPLYAETHALSGPDANLKRDDFHLSELIEGKDLYVWQKENAPLSGTIFRIRIHEISPERMILAQENISATQMLVFNLVGVGDYQAILMLSRHKGDVWNYYHLIRYGDGSRSLTENQRASLVNRAVAAFRYLGGLTMDREPPAAP